MKNQGSAQHLAKERERHADGKWVLGHGGATKVDGRAITKRHACMTKTGCEH